MAQASEKAQFINPVNEHFKRACNKADRCCAQRAGRIVRGFDHLGYRVSSQHDLVINTTSYHRFLTSATFKVAIKIVAQMMQPGVSPPVFYPNMRIGQLMGMKLWGQCSLWAT